MFFSLAKMAIAGTDLRVGPDAKGRARSAGRLADVYDEVCDDDEAEDVLPGRRFDEAARKVLRGSGERRRGRKAGCDEQHFSPAFLPVSIVCCDFCNI